MWPPIGGAASADDLADGGPKGGLVFSVQGAELADDETLFEGGDDRLDGGGLEQSGALPVAQPDFAEGGGNSAASSASSVQSSSGRTPERPARSAR